MSRLHDVSLYAAIPYISGKGGTALASFVRIIQGIRSEVKNMDLPAAHTNGSGQKRPSYVLPEGKGRY